MSILKVTYADLSHASKYAKKAANELDDYASKMEGGVARKISSISGGQSNRTSTALYETQLKIAELREKSDKLNNYANRIEQFENSVKETDNKVAKRIKAISATFAKDNGFKIGKVSAFFEALAVNTVNSTSLGRWVKDVYNKAEDKTNDLKTEIKHWFKTGGGRYIIDVADSVLNFTVAAVVAVIAVTAAIATGTVGLVIIAVAAVVIATIEAANLISNIRYTKKAVEKNKDDPAWAYRYGKTDTLSDSLRLEGHDKAANIVGITYVAANCVLVVDGIYNLGKMVISKSSSIKALVANKKDTFKIFRYNKGIGKQAIKGGSKASYDAVRNIADTNGLRNESPLTDVQVQELTDYAKSLGFPEDNIVICGADSTNNTGLLYGQRLYINNDVLPSNAVTNNPNSLVSGKGTIAHEIVGHYETISKGTAFETMYYDETGAVQYIPKNLALDEAQASIRAARFAPDLSLSERITLIRDGLTRLKNQGISLKDVKQMLDIFER